MSEEIVGGDSIVLVASASQIYTTIGGSEGALNDSCQCILLLGYWACVASLIDVSFSYCFLFCMLGLLLVR